MYKTQIYIYIYIYIYVITINKKIKCKKNILYINNDEWET